MDKIYKISNKEIDVLDSGSFDSEKEEIVAVESDCEWGL